MSDEPVDQFGEALLALDKAGLIAAADSVVASASSARARQAVDAIASALEIVGQRFQDGEWFLGELVYSGEIVKEAMQKLSPLIESLAEGGKGRVLVGTVFGDLHDLGKDIFSNFARSAGFDVIDLGVNVPIEEFTRAAKQHQPVALGMSCLLTSCAGSVERVVEDLERNAIRDHIKVIVGGAALTAGFAEEIGADAFAPDAVTGTDIIRRWSIPE